MCPISYVYSVGPYCEIKESGGAINALENCGSFNEYLAGLNKEACKSGDSPGVFSWTPDETTPDIVYYQVCAFVDLVCVYRVCVLCSVLHIVISVTRLVWKI